MRNKFLVLLLSFLILAPTTAQDETPLPVLHAEDIFAEGVTVLERLPILNYDDEVQQLYYFEPEAVQWISYDYPPYAYSLQFARSYGENQYFVLEMGNMSTMSSEFYFLDIETGEYVRHTLSCEQLLYPEQASDWFFVSDGLCHHPSNTKVAMPSDIVEIREAFVSNDSSNEDYCLPQQIIPRQSPDADYVLVPACTDTEAYLYRYNIAENSSEQLVYLTASTGLRTLAWYDNQSVYVESLSPREIGQAAISTLYSLDTLTGNLELIIEDIPEREVLLSSDSSIGKYIALDIEDNVLHISSYDFSSQILSEIAALDCNELPFKCDSAIIMDYVSEDVGYIVIRGYVNEDTRNTFIISSKRNEVIYSHDSILYGRQTKWVDEHSFYWHDLFEKEDGVPLLHMMTFDDSGQVSSEEIVHFITFSPDGRFIVYRESEQSNEIYVLDKLSGEKTKIMTIPDDTNIFALYDKELMVEIYTDNDKRISLASWLIDLNSDNQ